MGKKFNEVTAQPSTPNDADLVLWGQAAGSGLAYKMTFTQLKAKLDAMASLTTLNTPTLTATVISATQINLSWTNVPHESSFKLEWSANGTTGWTQIGGTIAANTTSFSHTGLTASTAYYYRVSAIGDGVTYATSGFGTANGTTSAASSYQTESDTFFAANTGLTTTQKDALDALVVSMKGIGWSKFKAIYPFIGGTADAHKWNLVNPADTDGGFRITWTGGITHSATGVLFDGSSGYGDTKLVPSTVLTTLDSHFLVANRKSSINGGFSGSFQGSTYNNFAIQLKGAGSTSAGAIETTGVPTATNTTYNAVIAVDRPDVNNMKILVNGTKVSANNNASTNANLPNTSVYLGAANGVTAEEFSDAEMTMVCIGASLTNGEHATLSTAIATYNTALSR
jgi:hypothetical protein